MAGQAGWVAIDWGTSNVRAWGIGEDGETVFTAHSGRGMGRLASEDYPGALTELLDGQPVDESADVLVCGMAGARQGWVEAPYLDAPADLLGLGLGAVSPESAGRAVRILPGVCQKANGAEDVMRGEETQLLGLSRMLEGNVSGAVCMPGTHSKWAILEGSRLQRFSTAMTGEVFEVLRSHSVLRHSLGGQAEGPEHEAGFGIGADLGLDRPDQLTSLLFRTRAASLLAGRGPDWCSGFLSGLLIGAEIGGHRDWIAGAEIPLIGSARLCSLYADVLARIGAHGRMVDAAEVTLIGLKAARSTMSRTEGGAS